MVGKIICCVISFGCAILFYSIGAYAQKSEKPMWFWSGTEVNTSQVTDIPKYNRENAIMWKCYSLWYVAGGVAALLNVIAFAIILTLSCTVGLGLLIWAYERIYKKYKAD